MREGWTIQIFDSFEDPEEAKRAENLSRSGRERIRILTDISTPNDKRTERGLPILYELLDGPKR
jgi:hypothetical protein